MNSLILWAAAAPQTTANDMDMWDMIIKGGWLMIPILLLSVAGVYIMCERYFAIKKAAKTNPSLTADVIEKLHAGNIKSALEECDAEHTPAAYMLRKGIRLCHLPIAELRSSMENTASSEIAKLEKGLPTLATVAGLAPMIGFLGTVVGMVQAFYDMSLAGNNINITLLSRGIYTAMITTVAGLIVGIIAYFGYNLLVSKINTIANKLEENCTEFLDSVYDIKGRK